MSLRTFLGAVISMAVATSCFAQDNVRVFTTLGCGNPPPETIVVYELDGRYPIVTELLDLASGAAHEIRVIVPNPNGPADRAVIDFLFMRGMTSYDTLGTCDSEAECKDKVKGLCDPGDAVCKNHQTPTQVGYSQEMQAKYCTAGCCSHQGIGMVSDIVIIYCFKIKA